MQTLPPDRVVVRARSLAKRGNQDAARDLLIDAAKRFPQNKKLRKALVLLDMPKVGPRPGGLDEKVKHLGILCRQGEHRAAIKLASQLLELHPGDPIVMTLLAAAYVASEKPAEALPIFELVIRQAPTFARAWTGFGTALAKTNRHHQAVRALNQSLSLSPLDVEALNNLGTSLRELNQHEEALSCFERIIELEDSYKARLNLGTTLLELGRAEESEAALRLAIAEKPDYTFAHRCLTLVRKYTADDPHLAQMEALNNAPDATRETRAQLGFALAKAYEDVGDYKRSFDALAQGNAARQDEIGYDATLEKNRFGTLTTLFRDYELSPIEFKPIPYRPIFVVGMPRSGTSLCEQILSRHHAVWGAGELEDLRRAVIRAAEGNNRRLSQAMIRQVRSIYLSALSDIDAPHGVITDKMPGNFRFVGFMRLAFPEAKIIHMRRDPMAVCWSLFKSYFAVDGHGYAYNLADAADYYKLYCDLMAVYEGLWPDTLCSINYEALTEDPETHIRTLLDACDLPFDPACLESHRSTRAVRTVSALQVRSAIYKGSSEAWRKFEPHLDPLMDRLADHGLGPKAPSPTGAPASHDSAEVRAVSPPSAG